MKELHNDVGRLKHILLSINKIEKYIEGLSFDEFNKTDICKSAVTSELIIIGEAVSRLSDSLRTNFSETEWKGIKNLRNVLVHEYFAIDYSVIWELIKYNLVDLKEEIKKIQEKIK